MLSAAGAAVTIADLDRDRVVALARELPNSSALIFDVTEEAAVDAALAAVENLDIAVNCSGVGHVGTIEETEADNFRRLLLTVALDCEQREIDLAVD